MKYLQPARHRRSCNEPGHAQELTFTCYRRFRNIAEHAPAWLPPITRQRGRRTERLFWQSGGGFDRNIWEPRTLMSMIDYIHMNPVRRGPVAKARDWRWSSAGWFEGNPTCDLIPDRIPPEWVPQD